MLRSYRTQQLSRSPLHLIVKEGKARDEVVVAIEARYNSVLPVVTEQFHGGEHSETSVLEFLSLTLCQNFWAEVGLALFKREEGLET